MSERKPLTGRCRCGHADWMHHDDAYMAGGKVMWGPCRERGCSCEGHRPEPTVLVADEPPPVDEVACLRAALARVTAERDAAEAAAKMYAERGAKFAEQADALQSRLTAAEAERDARAQQATDYALALDETRGLLERATCFEVDGYTVGQNMNGRWFVMSDYDGDETVADIERRLEWERTLYATREDAFAALAAYRAATGDKP